MFDNILSFFSLTNILIGVAILLIAIVLFKSVFFVKEGYVRGAPRERNLPKGALSI
ncbi:MAG: hypothetical protein WAQ27_02750 [Candidatus Microsaccharimonas sp.]